MNEDPRERPSYAEAMNQWAASREAQRTIFSKTRNTVLRPDPLSSIWMRLFGWVWRLAALAALCALGWYLMLAWHVRHKTFRETLARAAAGQLGAPSAEFSPLRWRKNIASARSFTAAGGPGTFFKSIEAENVDLRLPLSLLLRNDWHIDRIGIGNLKIDLRSGSLTSKAPELTPEERELLPPDLEGPPPSTIETDPDKSSEPASTGGRKALDLRLFKNGLTIDPDFEKLVVDAIEIGAAELTWGLGSATRGRLFGAPTTVTSAGEGWRLALTGGTLEQNWLRRIDIRHLNVHCTSGAIDLADGLVSAGEGEADVRGRIVLEANPRLDLVLDARRLPLDHFLDEPCVSWMRLTASGPIRIGGSVNLLSGVTTEADLAIDGGALRQLPILNTLAVVTARARFRDVGITAGRLKFTTGGGRLDVSEFELHAGTDIVIRGAFKYSNDQFNGSARLGLSKEYAERIPPAVMTDFFRQEGDGLHWMDVPLEGSSATLTKSIGDKLAAAYQVASQR